MEQSQGYNTSDRCPKNTPMKLRNWLNEIGIETQITVAENCHPTHFLNPLKGS